MKKILLAGGKSGPHHATLDFAAYIARLGKSKLVGLFTDRPVIDIAPSVRFFAGEMNIEAATQYHEVPEQNEEQFRKSIQSFNDGCAEREIVSDVRIFSQDVMAHIIAETRYADLLVVDPSFSSTDEYNVPSKFAIDLFHRSECPVLIAPEAFEVPQEIVFAYDGSLSSVFAIKQFYLYLPELAGKKVTVLHISHDNKETDLSKEEKENFKEWLDMHSVKYSFLEIAGDPKEELFKYFLQHNQHNDKLLVTGAFGRNIISSLLRKSTADLVLKAIDVPVFLSHI